MSLDNRTRPAAGGARRAKPSRWQSLGGRRRRRALARERGLIMDTAAVRSAAVDGGDPVMVPFTGPDDQRPSKTGWSGRGGGAAGTIVEAPEWRGTTVQVCGLFPFAAGSGMPTVGAPLGRHLKQSCTVCADPVSWFEARLVGNPSAFILGRPALGKSSLSLRIMTMLDHQGVIPLVMADLKPDYVDHIAACGGDVIKVGRGIGSINPLDPGPVLGLLAQMSPPARAAALGELQGRQEYLLCGLLEIVLQDALSGNERNLLTAALRLVNQADPLGVPLLQDVLDTVRSAPPALRNIALDRGKITAYHASTVRLEQGLMALGEDGEFGEVFCRPTTTPIQLGRPTCFDVSGIPATATRLQAAVQAVCWSYGSAAVNTARMAADDGIGEPVTYYLVMDELWRILRAGPAMISLIDDITRLNRQLKVGQIMITHTMADLVMPTEEQTRRAWGFVERAAMVFIGGLADKEMGNLREVFAMSETEVATIQEWSDKPEVDPLTNKAPAPPGRGKFLLKIGKGTGVPFQVHLTPAERSVSDSNSRWAALRYDADAGL